MYQGFAEHPPQAFANTGPQGHRGRMRARLLAAGPDSLADYEMVEMLLFLSIPRRDTKPFAKALIHRFGGLLGVLTAEQGELAAAGLTPPGERVWALVRSAAERLAQAEDVSRPLLNTPDRLMDYLDPPRRLGRPAHLAALFLNNRNQLLGEEAWPAETPTGPAVQALARRAVALHATAMILVRSRPDTRPRCAPGDAELVRAVRRAGKALSVTLHDHVVIGRGEPFSFREFHLL